MCHEFDDELSSVFNFSTFEEDTHLAIALSTSVQVHKRSSSLTDSEMDQPMIVDRSQSSLLSSSNGHVRDIVKNDAFALLMSSHNPSQPPGGPRVAKKKGG